MIDISASLFLVCEDSERVKYLAWGIRSQGWNPKEVTEVCTSGGACGLMRQSARKLTSSWHLVEFIRKFSKRFLDLVKTGAAWLSSARAARSWSNIYNERNPIHYLLRYDLHTRTIMRRPKQILAEAGDDFKSVWPLWTGLLMCHNGMYRRCKCASMSKSLKHTLVRIALWNSRAWSRNR